MCTGGRVINYLRNFLPDYKNDIIFVGYQSPGTLGRDILTYSITNKRGRRYVIIDGKRTNIKADIHEMSGYSAHADKNDLVRWVKRFREKPAKIFLVPGETDAKKALKKELNANGLEIAIANRKKYII
ncbi:MAG: hypothetical protein MRK02_05705 [Candidatus Scalindua sp.]|nr:hypothetical protein [Candidatus Scalindua sp.]